MMDGISRAGVAFDPLGTAVGIVFFFPDGNGRFDGVDDRAAGAESCFSVGSGNGDANGYFTNLQMPSAVDAAGSDDVMLGMNFR